MAREQAASRARLKIVVVGEPGAGKTTLVARFASTKFAAMRYRASDAEITTQRVTVRGELARLAIWDVDPGAAALEPIFRDAHAALLVYDVTDQQSLRALPKWIEALRAHASPRVPLIVAGAKAELPAAMPATWGPYLAERVGAKEHFLVSAQTNLNVIRLLSHLVDLAYATMTAALADAAAGETLDDRDDDRKAACE